MMYKVISRFRDNDGQVYEVGEDYPKGDSKPIGARIEQLSSVHPKYKRVFIEAASDDKTDLEEKEKEEIKAELESIGVSFHPNTGLEKLREKLEEAKASKETKE
ncbi:hypothetical protein [Bacillus sp. JJ1474]|uniref:hypothetical protein n=1 Tax=Bacillus sp. JJ1474 TaxID=3122955 RepID=UPI002FFF3B41